MTRDKAIHILTDHNKWRRGQPPYDGLTPEYKMNVKELGEAIDYAVEFMGKHNGPLHTL